MMAKPQQARKVDNILPPVKGPPAKDGVWDHTENFKFL
jgi:hypothetical protein